MSAQSAFERALERGGGCDDVDLPCGHIVPPTQAHQPCDECQEDES